VLVDGKSILDDLEVRMVEARIDETGFFAFRRGATAIAPWRWSRICGVGASSSRV